MASTSTTKRRTDNPADRAAVVARDFHQVSDAAKHLANDSVAVVRDTTLQYLGEGRSRIRHFNDELQSRVAEQPLKSLLIAASIGFLLGAIWIRR